MSFKLLPQNKQIDSTNEGSRSLLVDNHDLLKEM